MKLRLALASLLTLLSCEGPTGPEGTPGTRGGTGKEGGEGPAGPSGDQGPEGPAGEDGTSTPARGAVLTGSDLAITILGAGISASGTATVGVAIADRNGVPLDTTGLYTSGTVSLSFVLASRDATGEYTAYTTRSVTSPITTVTAIQAAADTGGTLIEVAPGQYRYTFAASAANGDRARVHTIGVYGTRTLGELRSTDDVTFDFVPGGGGAAPRPSEISNEGCNGCHAQLSAHGGARKKIELCVLCHSAQTIDPDTGNTVDFEVMIHKIHRGKELPSVLAGEPYRIIGFRQSVNDFSTVAFPRDIRQCASCHVGPAQGWATKPAKPACLGCHDRTSFSDPPPAGFTLHGGGEQAPNAPCAVCHPSRGSIAPIIPAHLSAFDDPARAQIAVELRSMSQTRPGETPIAIFRVTVNSAPRDILASPMTSLRATIAGPNTDYARYWQSTLQGNGASGTLTAVDAADGVFQYAFPASAAIPRDARGSFTLAMEATLRASAADPLYAAFTPVLPFAVTGTVAARRAVIDAAKCNSCHGDLSFHGGGRKNAQYCTLCHNAANLNDERMSRLESADALVHSVDLPFMIHRIHTGEALTQPFVLGGFPAPNAANPTGTPVDFREVRYPGIQGDCNACHMAGTWALPLPAGLAPTHEQVRTCAEDPAADADSLCATRSWVVSSTITYAPAAKACLGCHDSTDARAHAEVNTTLLGAEACTVCHGPGANDDVARVHPILP